MSVVSAKVAKANIAKRAALSAALDGRPSGSSSSLSRSYGLPLEEVQRAMRSAGVIDNG